MLDSRFAKLDYPAASRTYHVVMVAVAEHVFVDFASSAC